MINKLPPDMITRIKQLLPKNNEATGAMPSAINFFKRYLRLDLDFNTVEDTYGNYTTSITIFDLILAKSEPEQNKKISKHNASKSLLDKLNALPEPMKEAFINIVYDKTNITEEEVRALNDIISPPVLTDPIYLKQARKIYNTMSINKETESTDPLLALKTKPNYAKQVLQLIFELFGISSLFKALPLRTPQNIQKYEDTTKLLLNKELSLDSISKEAIAHSYIEWFNARENDKKIIEKFLSALNESELYLSSQENDQDRAKYYSKNYLARLVEEISKYDEANMPDYFKEMIPYLNPKIIWENSVKSGNFIVYQFLSQSGTVDFSSYLNDLNDEFLAENINLCFSGIAPALRMPPKDAAQVLDIISLLMKLMKDINTMDILTVEMIISNKYNIDKNYTQEFIKCLLDKNYDFKTIMPTSLDLIKKTMVYSIQQELFAALSNKYNLSEAPAEDIAVYVRDLIVSGDYYQADLLLTSGVLVTKVPLKCIIQVIRKLSDVLHTDDELYMSEMKKLLDLADHVREFGHELALLGNHYEFQEHIDYSSPE